MRRTARDGRATIAIATMIWNQPVIAKATPSGIHPPACDGTIARWMAPAPAESTASSTRPGTLRGSAPPVAPGAEASVSASASRSDTGIAFDSRSRIVMAAPQLMWTSRSIGHPCQRDERGQPSERLDAQCPSTDLTPATVTPASSASRP
jgi:hypothetical protein